MLIVLPLTVALLLGALTLGPVGAPAGPADLAPPPSVSAGLEPSCTEEVPVPTVTATVTNHGDQQLLVSLRRNGVAVDAFFVVPGAPAAVEHASPHWEDTDNLFELVAGGEVLASLAHHFDCLHPILEVDIAQACAGEAIVVGIANLGAEGTHIDVTLDGAPVASPPVAPGHSVEVGIVAAAGQVIEVHHHGELLAAEIVGQCVELPSAEPHSGAPPAEDPRTRSLEPDPSEAPEQPATRRSEGESSPSGAGRRPRVDAPENPLVPEAPAPLDRGEEPPSEREVDDRQPLDRR